MCFGSLSMNVHRIGIAEDVDDRQLVARSQELEVDERPRPLRLDPRRHLGGQVQVRVALARLEAETADEGNRFRHAAMVRAWVACTADSPGSAAVNAWAGDASRSPSWRMITLPRSTGLS